MRTSLFLLFSLVLTVSACSALRSPDDGQSSSSSSIAEVSSSSAAIRLLSPTEGSKITSPLTLIGEAPGTWFFEANIVVEITDDQGNRIAIGPGQAEGEWMTTAPVKFHSELPFNTTEKTGFIVIRKDNPSGLPENDASVRFPIQF